MQGAALIRFSMKPAVLASTSDAIKGILEASNKADWKKVKEYAEYLVKVAGILTEEE